jgi:hypothetical protein
MPAPSEPFRPSLMNRFYVYLETLATPVQFQFDPARARGPAVVTQTTDCSPGYIFGKFRIRN